MGSGFSLLANNGGEQNVNQQQISQYVSVMCLINLLINQPTNQSINQSSHKPPSLSTVPCVVSVTARAPGVPGFAARAVTADDRGQAAGLLTRRRLQRSRGPQSAQVTLRTSQSPRRKGGSDREAGDRRMENCIVCKHSLLQHRRGQL